MIHLMKTNGDFEILHCEIMWEAPQSSRIRLYTEKDIIKFD